MLYDEVLPVLQDLLTLLQPEIERIRDIRKGSLPWEKGLFPNFKELDSIKSAAESANIISLGSKIEALIPATIKERLCQDDRLVHQLLCTIIAAFSYPDLLGQTITPERVGQAISDLTEGYITTQTITVVEGLYTDKCYSFGPFTLRPIPSGYSFWLSAQVPWGTMIGTASAHAVVTIENRIHHAQVPTDMISDEPTSHAVQALRLATDTNIRTGGTISRGLVFDPTALTRGLSSFASGTQWWTPKVTNFISDFPRITEQHVKEAEYLLRFIQDENNILNVPIRRFDLAINRPTLKDKLVDLVTAAEALFLDKSEKEILTYRLKMRGARLIFAFPERSQKASWLGQVYDLRSSIVHGDRENKKLKQLNEHAEEFGEFVRTAIRYATRLVDAGYNNIPSLLDDAFLGDPAVIDKIEELHNILIPTPKIGGQDIMLEATIQDAWINYDSYGRY